MKGNCGSGEKHQIGDGQFIGSNPSAKIRDILYYEGVREWRYSSTILNLCLEWR
jgi:hypothetical protein